MTAPAPVPALPDTQRQAAYSITAQTGPFAVNFDVYGDGTDYDNWIEVWLNSVQLAPGAFTLTSPSGSIGTLPRPITDAVVTLTTASTGTLEIVGARRPRRTSQFSESRGVSARDLNQVLTDVIAQMRESWDRMRIRMFSVPAGETPSQLPMASLRANKLFGFDGSGSPLMQAVVPVGGMSVIQLTLTRSQIPSGTLALNTLMVSGYAAPGDDGAGAIFTSQGAGPASAGAIQDLSGTWFRLVPNNGLWNVGWFGAKGDDATDNTGAFQATINAALASATAKAVYVPNGIFWFPAGSASLDPGAGGISFVGAGDGSILHFSEGTVATPKQLFKNEAVVAKTDLSFDRLKFLGTAATVLHAAGASDGIGAGLWLAEYNHIKVTNCFFENVRGLCVQCFRTSKFTGTDNRFKNVVQAFWLLSIPDTIVSRNYVFQCGDDAIDVSQAPWNKTGAVAFKDRCVVTENLLVNCGGLGIACHSGAREINFSDNILKFTGGISCNLAGPNSISNLIIDNNVILDSLSTDFATGNIIAASNGIEVKTDTPVGQASTNNTIPTHYNTTSALIELPWNWYDDGSTIPIPTGPQLAARVISPAARVRIQGNIIGRTAKAVANFADYGLGFNIRDGSVYNSSVADGVFRTVGIKVEPHVYDVAILDNMVSHVTVGVSLGDPAANNYGFKNVRIAGNQVTDASSGGADVRRTGATALLVHMDIIVENNIFDIDPYRLNANSNVNGSYAADVGPFGLLTFTSSGLVIRNNTFKNCGAPTNGFYDESDVLIEDNLLVCGTPTALGFNVGNKGIGNLPVGFSKWKFKIINADPTSATYQAFVSIPTATSAAMPSGGWYPKGWFVWALTPTGALLGWSRLTTGSAHVLNTDWVVVA